MKNPIFILAFFVALLFNCQQVTERGQDSLVKDQKTSLAVSLDSLVESYQQSDGLSTALLIAKNDAIIYQRALGFANPNTGEKLTIDSPFNLASVSKQFITMAAMILKEAGKLGYDDNVKNYLPDFPYEGITIRNLMTHTSGLTEYFDYYDKHFPSDKIFTNQDMLDLFVDLKPKLDFQPGDQYQYSNTGYLTLALCLEKAAEQPIADYVTENIIQPLGLENTFPYNKTMSSHPPSRVFGYQVKEDSMILNDLYNIDGVFGDGNMYSSAVDLQKWSQGIYNNSLVSEATIQEAFTPFTLNSGEKSYYGFGWGLEKDGNKVSHTGGWVGFLTWIRRDLEEPAEIILLTNSSFHKFREFREKLAEIVDTHQ